jgi:hypothetical protein
MPSKNNKIELADYKADENKIAPMLKRKISSNLCPFVSMSTLSD